MVIHPALLAVGFVLVGSLSYDPHVLTLRYPDGHQERLAATSRETCEAAIRALVTGMWHPSEIEPAGASCQPGDIFPPGSTCIAGHNCGTRQ